jgi:predicted anti-sigma-YlaC factor YlaD
MSNCLAIEELLSEYLEGSMYSDAGSTSPDAGVMSPDARLKIEMHLKGCASCEALHQTMLAVLRWANNFPVYSSSEDLVPRILADTIPVPDLILTACPAIEAKLSDYIDQGLEADAYADVGSHLAVCGECTQLHEGMVEALRWSQALPSYPAPEGLVSKILASTAPGQAELNFECPPFQERLSELIDGLLSPVDALSVTDHLEACGVCHDMHQSMVDAVGWGQSFPSYDAPEWLATRILANTPETQTRTWTEKETWLDTLAGIGRWIIEPRMAMTVFTSVLVLGWMSNVAGLSLDPATLTNPTAMYYNVEELADDVYDRSVRFYYGVPHRVFDEIQSRFEQLRETSDEL